MSEQSSPVLTPDPLAPVAAPLEERPKSKLRWAIHLVIMAALPIVAGLSGTAASGRGPALTGNARGLLLVAGYEVLFFGIFFGAAWFFSRASKDDLLFRWRPRFWVLPLGVIYSVAIRFTVAIVLYIGLAISTGLFGTKTEAYLKENQPNIGTLLDIHALTHDAAYFWLNVVLVSFVVGGLREEVWRSSFLAGLRALWPRTFGSDKGGILGAAVAALFFGFGHLPQGVLAAALVTIVGFLLGIIMTQHRSIWPSAIAHGFFDAASMVLLFALQFLPLIQGVLEALKVMSR